MSSQLFDFVIKNFRMFAPVQFDGFSGHAHVDTGSVRSMVPQSLARDFDTVGRGSIKGTLGGSRISKIRVNRLRFLGTEFSRLVFNTFPDESRRYAIRSLDVVMTAGVDVLFQKPLCVDFDRRKIGFLTSSAVKRRLLVPLCFIKGLPFLELFLGSKKLFALFDTGAGYSVLNRRLLKTLMLEIRQEETKETHDPTGAIRMIPTFSHPRLALSGASLGRNAFLAMDLTNIERMLGSRIDFILGFNTIRNHNWIVDKRRSLLTTF